MMLTGCVSNNVNTTATDRNVNQDSAGKELAVENNSQIDNTTEKVYLSTDDNADRDLVTVFEGIVPNESEAQKQRAYRVGVGDILAITVYKVDSFSMNYQLDSAGNIHIPLYGPLPISGLTVNQIQQKLTTELSKNILRNPQINVTVLEYSSQQIAVYGEVAKPNVYNVKQGVNIYELLTMAGDFTKDTGNRIYLKYNKVDPITQESQLLASVINRRDMYTGTSMRARRVQHILRNLILGNGDSVLVEKSGSVFIDGAIEKPGRYNLSEASTVTELLALAGGGTFTSSEHDVKILRQKLTPAGEKQVSILDVNVPKIRNSEHQDVELQEGDIVTIGQSAYKFAFKGFFDYVLRLAFLL